MERRGIPGTRGRLRLVGARDVKEPDRRVEALRAFAAAAGAGWKALLTRLFRGRGRPRPKAREARIIPFPPPRRALPR